MKTSATPGESATPDAEDKKLRRLLLNRDSAKRSRERKASQIRMLLGAVRAVCEITCPECQSVLQTPAVVKNALDAQSRMGEYVSQGPARPFDELEYLRNKALQVEVQLHRAEQEVAALRAENAALRASASSDRAHGAHGAHGAQVLCGLCGLCGLSLGERDEDTAGPEGTEGAEGTAGAEGREGDGEDLRLLVWD